ncbi:MAG: hypothetical protein RL523_256 [Actinomycetota bacterium]|jgi:hypothetical protein
MQDLQHEITRITGIRRLIDVIGIFAGLTALLFPMFFGIVFQPREHYFTAILIWNVSMGLLPIAFNLMVLAIALRLRARELDKIAKAEPEQAQALLDAYLTKIDRHRIVLLTVGWLAVAKAVLETLIPLATIAGILGRAGEYSSTLVMSVAIQMGVTVAQGLIFAFAQFGLAKFLKLQGLRLGTPKAEITTN